MNHTPRCNQMPRIFCGRMMFRRLPARPVLRRSYPLVSREKGGSTFRRGNPERRLRWHSGRLSKSRDQTSQPRLQSPLPWKRAKRLRLEGVRASTCPRTSAFCWPDQKTNRLHLQDPVRLPGKERRPYFMRKRDLKRADRDPAGSRRVKQARPVVERKRVKQRLPRHATAGVKPARFAGKTGWR